MTMSLYDYAIEPDPDHGHRLRCLKCNRAQMNWRQGVRLGDVVEIAEYHIGECPTHTAVER